MEQTNQQAPARVLIGSFFFRDEGDGCITGKYFNTGLNSPLVEAAKLKCTSLPNRKFCGQYNTIWLDMIDDPSGLVFLTIEMKTNDIYKLTWSEPESPFEATFRGEAMLAGELLVGCYWAANVIPNGY